MTVFLRGNVIFREGYYLKREEVGPYEVEGKLEIRNWDSVFWVYFILRLSQFVVKV